jgi:hypothetical protein
MKAEFFLLFVCVAIISVHITWRSCQGDDESFTAEAASTIPKVKSETNRMHSKVFRLLRAPMPRRAFEGTNAVNAYFIAHVSGLPLFFSCCQTVAKAVEPP